MAATAGMHGYNTKVFWAEIGSTPTTQLAVEITNIPLPESEADDIDLTHMESPNKYREYVSGLIEGGELEMEGNYTRAGYIAALALKDLKKNYRITLPNLDTFTFPGYIKNIGGESPFDEKVSMTTTLKVAGAVTHAAGA